MTKSTTLIGPPGTGKTTFLLNIVKDKILENKNANIYFLSFTKKAALEAKDRINLTGEQIKNFGTIHSLAYKNVGANKNDMLSWRHKKEFCQILKIPPPSFKQTDFFEDSNNTTDKLFFIENYYRNLMITLEKSFDLITDSELNKNMVFNFCASYKHYKNKKELFDFTDLLERFLLIDFNDKIDCLIVDEAQDLSPLQWKVINKLALLAKEVWFAGDDDQGIFEWAGADVNLFINATKNKIFLENSYRLPKNILSVAQKLRRFIINSIPKTINPINEEGIISHIKDISQLNFNNQEETMLLVRNNYMLKKIIEDLVKNNISYRTKDYDSQKDEFLPVIKNWEKIKKGIFLLKPEIENLINFCHNNKLKILFSKVIIGLNPTCQVFISHESIKDFFSMSPLLLFNIPYMHYNFLCEQKANNLFLSTIHGSKGGEAEHVILFTDISKKAWNNLSTPGYKEKECRIFYTGVTRAKNKLTLVYPQTNYHVHDEFFT